METDFDDARAELTAALQRVARVLGMDLVRTGRDAEAAAIDVAETIARTGRRAAESGRQNLGRAIHDNPALLLGVACGLGALLALATRRR